MVGGNIDLSQTKEKNMKEIIQHEKYGTIEFSEGNIIANRKITVNGQELEKSQTNCFTWTTIRLLPLREVYFRV